MQTFSLSDFFTTNDTLCPIESYVLKTSFSTAGYASVTSPTAEQLLNYNIQGNELKLQATDPGSSFFYVVGKTRHDKFAWHEGVADYTCGQTSGGVTVSSSATLTKTFGKNQSPSQVELLS